MIYFDNSATSLPKAPQVAAHVAAAIDTLGNAGRSANGPAMQAARALWSARQAVADLAAADSALSVAFTSGTTESLNLVAQGLLTDKDAVITSTLEHNAVLRPLYRLGCELSFLPCDRDGALLLDGFADLLRPNTKAVFCTHGSNLLGSLPDIEKLQALCRQHGLIFVLDVAQTFGHVQTRSDMADILCFSGHKGLLGPQGIGGVIMEKNIPLQVVKTGGTGYDAFARIQADTMPDVLEAGTLNIPGLCGLQQGIAYLKEVGLEQISQKERQLTLRFLNGLAEIPRIEVYGPPASMERLPVVALNLGAWPSEELALKLWDDYAIATRPGSHCTPLIHEYFGTQAQGMVRFSFGCFNTADEIDSALAALRSIAVSAAV